MSRRLVNVFQQVYRVTNAIKPSLVRPPVAAFQVNTHYMARSFASHANEHHDHHKAEVKRISFSFL